MFAFWLLPAKPYALQARIQSLAETYNSQVFQPHVTLFSDECNDIDRLRADAVEAVRGFPEIKWPVYGVEAGSSFFQCVYIRLQFEQAANELIRKLRKRTGLGPANALSLPHLSLLYGAFPQEVRDGIAKHEPQPPEVIHFDRLAAVHPAGANGWQDIDQWETWFTLPLLAT